MSLTINKLTSPTDLHCHYDCQSGAQGCYIELDCSGEILSASYNAEIGNAIPFSVYHGHEQRFAIPTMTADAANVLMAEIAPLAERVIAGYESRWDGNNSVARFTDDAQAALDEITEKCDGLINDADESNTVQEWDAGDWLDAVTHLRDGNGKQCKYSHVVTVIIEGYGDDIIITKSTTDAELGAIESRIEDDLDENMVLNNLGEYLSDLRNACRENSDE